jgi:serine/threonine protein phosphatase PrpC
MRTRFAGLTDTGLMREHNEDSFLVMPEYRIAAVADGMGGHRSGDVASQLAVATLQDFFNVIVGRDGTWPFPADPNLSDEENYVVTGLRLAIRRIFDRSLKTMADFGMGTTIVAAVFSRKSDRITVGHVGDSRCYRIRGTEVLQMTRDHSLISDARQMAPWMSAEEVRQLPPNVITRALGIREDVLVDILSEPTKADDTYLLCSDGLSGLVNNEQILEIITKNETLEEACKQLVERANFYGGTDNITAVLARVEEGEPDPADEPPESTERTEKPATAE